MPCDYAAPGVLRGLLARALTNDERRSLAAHLEGGCPDCAAAIEEVGVDNFGELLLERAEAAAPRPWHVSRDEMDDAFGRVMAGAGVRRREGLFASLLGARFQAFAFAAASVALVAITVWYVAPQINQPAGLPGQTAKGDPTAGGVSLWFDVGAVVNGKNENKGRGAEGAACDAGDFLILKFKLDAPAFLYIVRRGDAGPADVVYTSGEAMEPAGTGSLKAGGQQAAFPLAGLSGIQRFTAVASPTALSRGTLLDASRIEGLPHATFSVRVGR